MTRSYTLHEIPAAYGRHGDPSDHDVPPSQCIYCEKPVLHVNDGGSGWIGGALLASGEPLLFMYHASPPCEASTRAPEPDRIWTCYCGNGPGGSTRDNVGPRCHNCGGPQPEHARGFGKGRRTDMGACRSAAKPSPTTHRNKTCSKSSN